MDKENYVIKNANEFSTNEKKEFKKIVLSIGEVAEYTFDGLMEKNPILLFYPNTIEIEAIGALKIPHKIYKNKVFAKSQSQYNSTEFYYELGWIVSLKQKEGIGKFITKVLSEFSPTMYSTVRIKNIGMTKILESLGFMKTGIKYKSEREDYYNNLYLKLNKNNN